MGLLMAFASAILFVTQNIFSKQIFNDAAAAEKDGLPPSKRTKPDKLNLLCYSSGLAFIFTLPLWLYYEGFHLLLDFFQDASISLSDHPEAYDHGRLLLEFIFNGTFHFGQNIVAFVLLSMVSPVTYSVASLIKRVFVIVFSIIWFGKPMTRIQGFGFAMTFVGLYLYDRMSDAEKADRRARAHQAKSSGSLLPTTKDEGSKRPYVASPDGYAANGGLEFGAGVGEKSDWGFGKGVDGWLPGSRQEDRWRVGSRSERSGASVGVS